MANQDYRPESEGGSVVVFQTAQGGRLQANLLRLTRYLAVFELYNPTCVLQTSEVLDDFRIILNGRLMYAGRALVSNLISTGPVLVCEVSLGECWRDVELSFESRAGPQLNGQFDDFIREWQKLYRVLPEYKVALADLQTFLADLRIWLEQLELNIRSLPPGERARAEHEIVHQLGPSVVPAINSLFDRFEEVARRIEPEHVPAHHVLGKRQLHPLLLCAPFVYRTYAKPLSYAGDYEMVNMMFRDPAEGESLFAKLVNVYSLQLPPILGHRNRIKYLTEQLVSETRRVAARNRRARVFNLGCGPAHEIQRFMANDGVSDYAEFTLADFNDETLAHADRVLNDVKRRYRRHTQLNFVKKSVQQILKQADRPARKPAVEQYDVIYCAGLFDYLADKVCRRLMDHFYEILAPGGLLIATNVDVHPARGQMECFLEWHLIYRDANKMLALSPGAATRANVAVKRDPTGVNVFIEVRKPENEK